MLRPWAPAYNSTIKLTAAGAGTPTQDFGEPLGPRSFRVYNASAGQVGFAFQPDTTALVADKGVILKAGDSIVVHVEGTQRYFALYAAAAYTVYITQGVGGVN